MSDNPFTEGRIGMRAEKTEVSVAPAGNTTIRLTLRNQGVEEDTFSLSVGGIPPTWISTATPNVTLAPGEEKEVTLIIQAPALTETSVGKYPLKIRATSRKVPDQFAEIALTLTVATLEVQGRIGLLMDSVQFTVAPGSSTTFSLMLVNNGLTADTLRMQIEGIPMGWVSTSSPVTKLEPGEKREIPITIQPPRAPESRAGRHAFRVRFTSEASPDEPIEAECTLTIAAFSEFSSDLQPPRMEATQNAQITVKNEGNIRETYTITWQSHEDKLDFEVGKVENNAWIFTKTKLHEVRVPEGKTATTVFRAGLRERPWIGGKVTYPYAAYVRSSSGETHTHNGEVVDQAIIPIWVLPVVLVLCLLMICIVFGMAKVGGNRQEEAAANQTATAMAATSTMIAYQTQAAQLTAGVPTNTPLPTFTPTFTAEPSETPLPTATEIPTEIPTETPSPEPTATEAPTDSPTEVPTEIPTEMPTEVPPPSLSGEIIFGSSRNGAPALFVLTTWDFNAQMIAGTENGTQAAWSPDGGRIAFAKDGDIFTVNPDGSNLQNLTNSPDSSEASPTWSPDGSQIAFASNRDGNWEIYVMASDGSGDPVNLTNSPANDTEPSWYKHGGLVGGYEKIAFTTDRDGNLEVYLMNPDGSDPRNLTNNPASDTEPAATYGDGVILFTTDRDGNREIYSVEDDGAKLVNLTNNPASDFLATWAKGGGWIAFTTDRDGNAEIYVMNNSGGDLYNLTQNPAEDKSWTWK